MSVPPDTLGLLLVPIQTIGGLIMPYGRAYAEQDTTPVYFSSKRLHVTGMKVTAGGSVHPVGAIATVEVLKKGFGSLVDMVRIVGLSAMLLGLSFLFMDRSPALLTFMTLALVALVSLCVYVLIAERTLHIRFNSGDSVKIPVYDSKAAWSMHSAVEQALTWNLNHAGGHSPSVADELSKLSELRDRGAISAEDWSRAKDLFLGKQPDAQQRTVQQLRQLHDLRKSGVLSESEFNMKKWDVLSRG